MVHDGINLTTSTASVLTERGVRDARLARQESFQSMIARANAPVEREARARQAAEQLIAATFVEPILKQAREMHKAAPPFGPGPGEMQFRALMDAELAHRLVRAGRWPLVERVASNLLGARTGAAPVRITPSGASNSDVQPSRDGLSPVGQSDREARIQRTEVLV